MRDDYEQVIKNNNGTRDGEAMKLTCPSCQLRTNHTVLTSVHHQWDLVGVISGVWDMMVVSCNGCEGLQFCKISSDDDSHDMIEDGKGGYTDIYTPKTELFPIFDINFKKPHLYGEMPKHVRKIYEETYDTIVSGNTILAGAGVRTIIEAICLSFGIKTGNLVSKINKMHEKGHVTESMKNLLHSIRVFGNSSVHADINTDFYDIQTAWDAIDNLIVAIYGTDSSNKSYEWKKSGWVEVTGAKEEF